VIFWLRHFLLIVCCVVLPFGAALYFDTQAEIERTREAGARAAEVATGGLDAHLKLRTARDVGTTRDVGQRIAEDLDLRAVVGARRSEEAVARTARILEESITPEGFGLILDPSGDVLVRAGEAARSPKAASFAGHPIFVRTQLGWAFDTFWSEGHIIYLLTAAPLVDSGVATGAVVRAQRVDSGWLATIGRSLDADLSLLDRSGIVASTLPDAAARELEAKLSARDAQPVTFGRLRTPITASNAPFLPLFVDHQGSGLGYTAMTSRIPHTELQWSVAVRSGEGLAELGERQAIGFAVMLASIMLAILIGLINARTFVGPLAKIESHLSEIQMGRGDVELPEVRVSRPYRRLVRLINMTVQKLPARGLHTVASTSTAEAPAPQASGSMPRVPGPPEPQPEPEPEPAPSPPPVDRAGDATGSDVFDAPVPHDSTEFDESTTPAADDAPTDERPAPDFSGNLEAPLSRAIDEMQAEPAPPPPRRAAEIRGASPRLESSDLEAEAPPPALDPSSLGSLPSLDLGPAGLPPVESGSAPPATVVSPIADDLLSRTAHPDDPDASRPPTRDLTAVDQSPPPTSPAEEALDPSDRAHFREVYERFIEMRRQCGETTAELGFERFLQKLLKNRDTLVQKYQCRTVRFQVYEKDGKAALKATPVRAR